MASVLGTVIDLILCTNISHFMSLCFFSCPRDLLESEFGKCGRVNDIFNTGKGYCFVTMADERDAKIAVEDLNGTTMDGQEIKVEISHG